MLSWDDLQYILAVRRHGSLANAAKALGLNKSTVGRRIAALEAELGVALTERGPLGYDLTSAGRTATTVAEQMERLVNELIAEVGGIDESASGTVRVTVPHWVAERLIIPSLPELRSAHPRLDVDLITTDDVLNLSRREADIAIRNQRPTQQSLSVQKVGIIAFGMYASPEYLKRHGTPHDRGDFEGHQLIAYQGAVAYVRAYRWTNSLSCPIAFRASDATSMLKAVSAGLGIGVLPSFITNGAENVVCLNEVGPPEPEVIWLVTHPDTRDIARVRVVAQWLLRLFSDHATWLAGQGNR